MVSVSRNEFRREVVPDEDPDLSYLGTYTDRADPAEVHRGDVIDRQAIGDMGPHEYRYFRWANQIAVTVRDLRRGGHAASASEARRLARQYATEDYRRVEAFNHGQWAMVGVRAAVVLRIPMSSGGAILQTIRSPGIWGIESDGDEAYLEETFQGECHVLQEILRALGVEVGGSDA